MKNRSTATLALAAVCASLLGVVETANAGTYSATFSVPGTSDPFLSGMPSGSSCCSGDSAPAESPVYAGSVAAGETFTFTSVTGSVSYGGGTPTDPPDGDSGYLIDTAAYEGGANAINNIAGYDNMPVDALIGVFLGPGLPTSVPAPSPLNFGTTGTDPLGTNFAALSPGLQQIFFIGDGLNGTGTGSVQTFVAPTGATRLFLGTVDGFGWYNNTGAIDVTVNGLSSTIPEPPAWAMMLVGFAGLAYGGRRLGRKGWVARSIV
jgi:hypothetical protein